MDTQWVVFVIVLISNAIIASVIALLLVRKHPAPGRNAMQWMLVVLAVLALQCSGLQDGPNRRSTVDSTPSGAANLKPDGTKGQVLDEAGGFPLGNYCSVTIGPNKETWVRGIGKIVIIPTTVQYTRTYELYG